MRSTLWIRRLFDQKDRPAGTILSTALSIQWLQQGLDLFVALYPFGSLVKTQAITISAETLAVPGDFVKDYRNGIILDNDEGRLQRRSLSHLLNWKTTRTGKPGNYAVVGSTFYFRPIPDKGYTAKLYYYSLPAVLGANDVPTFPSDIALVKYVWLRGLEWVKAVPPGSSEAFARDVIVALQKAGIGPEAEDDQIPLGRESFPGAGATADPSAWMGEAVSTGGFGDGG